MTIARSLLASILSVALAAPGHSQPTAPPPFMGTTLQVTVIERWRNAGQPDAATRYETRTENLRVARDERRPDGATVVVRGTMVPIDSSVVAVDARGMARVDQFLRPQPAARPLVPDSGRMGRFRLLAGNPRTLLVMPDARVWDLARSAPATPRAGARWIDTLRLETSHDGARVAIAGIRTSVILRDTLVDGRTLFIVRDSATIQYEERFLIEAYMLNATERIERRASGIWRGRWLLDPERGHPRWLVDSMSLTGVATLTGVDGATVNSPTRFDRSREVLALTPAQVAARQAGARPFSIVIVPFTDIEKRMAAEGPAIVDSLIGVVRRSSSARERDSLLTLLERWGRFPRARLFPLAMAIGDTTRALLAWETLPDAFTVTGLRTMLPLLDDRERLWRYGLTVDGFAERLGMRLRSSPMIGAGSPAFSRRMPGGVSTTADAACAPDVCRLLAELWPTARDPRLRAVGLLTRAMQDPRGWADTVRRNVGLAPGVLAGAVALIEGVGATWLAASKIPLPARGADWRRWSEWMTGYAPGAAPASVIPPRGGGARPPGPITRFEESHRNAIVVASAAQGRDMVSELREAFQRAADDSARLVLGTLAIHTNAIALSSDLVADWLTSGSPLRYALGRNALERFILDSARRLPDAEATPLIDSLLAILIDRAPRWTSIGDTMLTRGFGPGPAAGTLRLVADSLPAAVLARWERRLQRVSAGDRRPSDDPAGITTYRISPPVGAGRLVVLQYQYSNQTGPRAYAQGATWFLLRVGDGYRLVAVSSWIT